MVSHCYHFTKFIQTDDLSLLSGLDFICHLFVAKAPLLAYNSFVEAIFVLNDCDAHSGHGRSQSSRSESRLFSIRYVRADWYYFCFLFSFATKDKFVWSSFPETNFLEYLKTTHFQKNTKKMFSNSRKLFPVIFEFREKRIVFCFQDSF